MTKQPNIILIMTDQQRYDTIAALGFPYMKTPSLDRLVREGTSFENCFCAAPSCAPSRASFFNCRYPHEIKVYSNRCRWGTSWVEALGNAGYQCINVGKMHTIPMDAKCGFEQRYVVENKDRPGSAFLDEWDKFLLWNHKEKPGRRTYNRDEGYLDRLGAYEWPLEEEYYSDLFVGRMADAVLDRCTGERPLFMQIGFPGPHPPYDPPRRYIDMYDGVDLPLPSVCDGELERQPSSQEIYRREMMSPRFHDAVHWKRHPSRQELLRLRRHYAANVTLIDGQIGAVLDKCEERGLLDNAVVVFTSDHGDCLGDHGHIQKWTMYDCVTRVPAIFYSKNGLVPRGRKISGLVQQMDLAEALLEMAGIETGNSSAVSALPLIRGEREELRSCVYAEHARDNIFTGNAFFQMVRNNTHKLVLYHDTDEGELYDLAGDPEERDNRYFDPAYAAVRMELTKKLLDFQSIQ